MSKQQHGRRLTSKKHGTTGPNPLMECLTSGTPTLPPPPPIACAAAQPRSSECPSWTLVLDGTEYYAYYTYCVISCEQA